MKKLLFAIVCLFCSTIILAQEGSAGRISGLMFGDYFYNAARDTGTTSLSHVANGGNKDLNGFQFRRIYLTYDYDISEKFSSRFRLEADQNANTSDGKIGVFVKDAYLKWKDIFTGSDLILGIQPTPAFEVAEGVWGNRFLEKTIMDLRGIVSSRDFAVSLRGKIDNSGIFRYWIMIGNGSGNRPETDKYKRFYGHLQIVPIKQFTATLYTDLRARPDILDPTSTVPSAELISNNDITYAVFLGYSEKNFYSFGIEGFLNQRQNGLLVDNELKSRSAYGFSVFGSYQFSDKLGITGRFDNFDPNSDSNFDGDSRNLIIFSVNYKPVEKVTISPNVIIESYESIKGRSVDASVTPRITFFYSF